MCDLSEKIVVVDPRRPVAGAYERVEATGARNPQAVCGYSLDRLPGPGDVNVFVHPRLHEGRGMPHVSHLGGQPFQGRTMHARHRVSPDEAHRRIVGYRNRKSARLARSMFRKHGQSGTLQLVEISSCGQLAPDPHVVDRHVADDGRTAGRAGGGDFGRWEGFEPTQSLALLPRGVGRTPGGVPTGLEPRRRQGHEDPIRMGRPLGPLFSRPVGRGHRPPVQVADAEDEHQSAAAPDSRASS